MSDIKTQLQSALSNFASGSLLDSAKQLLNVLGYESERTVQLSPNNYKGFAELFHSGPSNFDTKKAKIEDWQTIDIIFQLTEDDIKRTHSLFETRKYSDKIIESYLFFALSLKGDTYTRGDLVRITREINNLTPMPAMILFRYNNYLTISVIDRRLHKRESTKDVLEKVTLIKEIQIPSPSPTGEGRGEVHRAHIEILHDLSIDELQRKTGFSNFIELHNAWRKTLDTSELNKKFFRELANWYFWAVSNAEFPDDVEKNKYIRNAISVIRMITRLIFIWFVKEKGLVSDELFNHAKLKNMLNFNDKNQSTYYKAILQNLFFATLNTEMNKDKPGSRKFRGKNKGDGRDQHYMIHNVFRYEDYFTTPQNTLTKYFENIPFLNGGLFECLDKEISSTLDKAPSHTPTLEKGGKGGFSDKKIIRIDAFSDRMDNPLKVPDYLFFSSEQSVDLNEIYGTKNKTYKVRGLIDILDSYKFTVDENTPIEEEIALDPELLGKVFENLLASYNPETQTTARKQTGSFYTPREIVNYMVDESIIAYLTQALSHLTPTLSFGEGSHNGDNQATPGWMTTNTGTYIGLKEFVKENRKNQTPAEGLLWEKLRNSQLGVKFRRQHPIGKFIADFVCLDKNLIIETDGGIHNEQKESDEQRDKTLLELGYRTVRFTNDEVIHDMEAVLKKIQDEVHALPLSPSPLAGTGCSVSPSPLERDGVRLRHLVAYNDDPHKFTPAEVKILIAAINTLKALDPACGSGAFPMGMLHKLVYILGKLDPDNSKWRELQKQKAIKETEEAYSIGDMDDRNKRLQDISEVFENNASDYGRKLYLIENCIFGVDIQPIAVQIAKLRFFVSLIVDQRIDPKKANLGVRPLPNLETKFVAANTLIGIEKPAQMLLRNPEIDKKEEELKKVRERHFTARTPQTKEKYRKSDEKLRAEISELLKKDGFPSETTEKLAKWNPYDQNASADFFDPEWMFGVTDGYDITIGNPPYVRADAGEDHLALRQRIIESKRYNTLWEKWDIFIPFTELGYQLLKPNGITTMIVSDAYCHSKYAQKSQNWFLQNSRILRLDFLSKIKVFEAGVHNIVYFFQKAEGGSYKPDRREHEEEFGKVKVLPTDEQKNLTYRAFFPEDNVRGESSVPTIALNDICYVCVGMVVNANEKLAVGAFDMNDLVVDKKDSSHPKAFVEGKHLDRWAPATNKYLEWGTKRAPSLFRRPTFPELYEVAEKILVQRSPGPDPKACYDNQHLHFTESSVGFISWHCLMNVRNNSLKKVARYKGEKPPRQDLPKREELEKTSGRFAVKYLLAVMNSSVARDFLRSNRRSNIHLYPDDWKKLPIPDVSLEKQKPIIKLVDQILASKKKDFKADTSALEKQIDEMVYALYGLTPEEIAIVEGKV